MLRQRIHYWSCSKLANLIRGCEKPPYLTMDDWEKWRSEVKAKSPIRYFIAEKLLNRIQDFINFPKDIYNSIRYYIRNRFITKTHYLKTGLEPGVYHELDERILYGLFNELVDFVEVEQAWINYISNDKKYNFKNGRCIESGLDHLKWASGLKYDEDCGIAEGEELYGKPTPQSESASKILELYSWWKDRKYRTDPMEASGWSDYCEKKKIEGLDDKKSRIALEKLTNLEEKYEKEDEDMLIELIKIRKHLWT
jgi:hypothetical protein